MKPCRSCGHLLHVLAIGLMLVASVEWQSSWADTAGRAVMDWTAGQGDNKDEVTGITKTDAGDVVYATMDCTLSALAPLYNTAREITPDSSSNDPVVASVTFSFFNDTQKTNALGSYDTFPPLNLDWSDNAITLEYAFNGDQNQQMNINFIDGTDSENSFEVLVGSAEMNAGQSLGLAIPLSDGTNPVVEINPSDPVLKNFINQCQNSDPTGDDTSSSDNDSQPSTPASPNDSPAPTIPCLSPGGATTSVSSAEACHAQNGVVMGQ